MNTCLFGKASGKSPVLVTPMLLALLCAVPAPMAHAVEGSALIPQNSVQKSGKVTGTVVDSGGVPIIGADVVVVGTTTGAFTDIDGKFIIDAKPGERLKVSYMGFKDLVVEVTGDNMNIVLETDQEALDEVVVIGYGTARKSTLTGALSQVSLMR